MYFKTDASTENQASTACNSLYVYNLPLISKADVICFLSGEGSYDGVIRQNQGKDTSWLIRPNQEANVVLCVIVKVSLSARPD